MNPIIKGTNLMSAKFKIQISDPCIEKWASMQQQADGRFCSSCQKSVVDFTQFSDVDLQNWFASNKSTACGRFNPEQLDRLIMTKPVLNLRRFKPALFTASLLAFLVMSKIGDASSRAAAPFIQLDNNKTHIVNAEEKSSDGDVFVLRGKLVDGTDDSPIIGALVKVKNSKITATTGENGVYELRLNKAQFKDKVFLEIRYIGYESKEVKLNLNKTNTLIKMKMDSSILGGFGLVKEPTLMRKFFSIFRA